MIRKIACALALVSASYAGFVQALGLGEATVKSSLNQPLRAEIQLVSADGLSDEEILPGLATREEFLKAGIDRVYFLSDIRFEVTTGSNGQPVVVLTTKKPVREPFLNFLVEVIWPSGRLLREYALLIDPPLFSEDKVVAADAAPAPVLESAPASTQPANQNVSRGDSLNVASSVQPQTGSLAGANSYGPTKSTDTLWDIALDARPDRSVSPQQVMLAIQDLNPNAFIDNNINKMKEGQILRLPTKEQIQSRSTATAIDEVIAQNAALRKPRTQSPTNVSNNKAPAPTSVAKSGGDELKLVVADKNSKASDSASSDPSGTSASGVASSEELALTLEKLDKATLENEELGDKVDALEDQLETLQRLLTLKNDQLAGLQAQMRANDLAEAEAQEAMSGEEALDEMASNEESIDGASDELSSDAAQASMDAMGSEADGEQQSVVEEGMGAESAPEQAEVQEPVAQAEPAPAPAPAAKQPSAVQKPIQDQVLEALISNPLYQAAAAGVLILLLIVLWMLSRKRADQESSYQEEDDDYEYEEDQDYEEDDYEEASEDEGDYDDEESEPASSDESEDVIAEADVYIAYGRLDQAATILEQGISADPVRVDYRLKLLEVYRDGLEEDAFNKQMSELEAIQDEDALAKAAVMREELMTRLKEQDIVEEPEPVEHLLDEDEAEELMQSDENNFDFDTVEEDTPELELPSEDKDELDELAEEVAEDIDLDSDDLDVDLDIDLDLDTVEDSLAKEEVPGADVVKAADESEVDDGAIDFDTSDLGLDEELEQAQSELDAASDTGDEKYTEKSDSIELETSDAAALDDIELDEDLNLETEIDLDLDMAEDLGVDLEDAEVAESVEDVPDLDADDLALDLDDELGLETAADEDEAASATAESDDLLAGDDVDAELLDADDIDDDALDAAVLDLGDEDDLVVTDETLDEAADALGDADEFEPELSEDEDFDFLEGTDEASTKLDLARAYIDMGDTDGAREILQEVEKDGNPEQQAQAKELIESLGG